MKIFISYCHKQAAWVQDDLLPVLDASGHEALIDRRRFTADEQLLTQMDNLQDEADHHFLVLSPDYLKSNNCRHEMARAIGRRLTVAKLVPCDLPSELDGKLYLEFHPAADLAAQWGVFARTFSIDWNISLHTWIQIRKGILRHLENRESVNLIVQDRKVRQIMLESLRHETHLKIGHVDFDNGMTATIEGTAQSILEAAGQTITDISPRQALMILTQTMCARSEPSIQIWEHFDNALARANHTPHPETIGRDFFTAIRHLTTPPFGKLGLPKLLLILVSTQEVEPWMKTNYGLSTADFKTLWLN